MKKIIFGLLLLTALLAGCASRQQEPYSFTYQEAQIQVGQEAGPILYALGEPVSATHTPSCAFEGLEITYYHGGIYLTTYSQDCNEVLQRAWFADDTAQTREGLRLGDSAARVAELYGCDSGDGLLTLESAGTRLAITTENGIVTAICYEAMDNG